MTDRDDPLIFLVDEDDVVRDSLKILLESHGLPVRDFRSARAFLTAAKSPVKAPAKSATGFGSGACLVLGCNRLIVDGLDLLAALRRRDFDLPVIFFVGGGDKSQKLTVLEAGAFAYLERPAEEAALIQVIKAALADGKTALGGKAEAERQSLAAKRGSILR